jgi:hypothetical protein
MVGLFPPLANLPFRRPTAEQVVKIQRPTKLMSISKGEELVSGSGCGSVNL